MFDLSRDVLSLVTGVQVAGGIAKLHFITWQRVVVRCQTHFITWRDIMMYKMVFTHNLTRSAELSGMRFFPMNHLLSSKIEMN